MRGVRWHGPRIARRKRLVRAVLAVVLAAAAMPGLLLRAPAAEAAADPVIAAVGDIACDPANSGFNDGLGTATDCRQKWTADLLSPTGPVGPVDAVLPLGDEQYGCGGLSAFRQVYDPTWGLHNDKSRPVPGNREYRTANGTGCPAQHDASGYYSYFGSIAGDPAKGYYSYDLGAWHILAVNSELCYEQSDHDNTPSTLCPAGSPMETWLRNDLATHPGVCTLAYWHEPRFASSPGRGDYTVDPLWQALAAAQVDVVLNGHQHFYERLAPMNGSGQADPNGVRQFIVGTGGESLMPLATRLPTSQAANDETYGVLKMTLHATSYDWQFVPVAGSTYTDSGSAACHPAQTDGTAPTTSISCNGAPCSGTWYGVRPVNVSLSATDTGGSGVTQTRYTTDGTDPVTSSSAVSYAGPFTVTTTTTVRFASVDNAGNTETANSQQIRIDSAAPATTASCNNTTCSTGWYRATVTVGLSATDAGGSGVATTFYTTDGTDPATSPTARVYTAPFPVTSTTTVKAASTDTAGNVEPTQSWPIRIDTTAPSTPIYCNGDPCGTAPYAGPVTVTLPAMDAGGSGLARTTYTLDGSDPATSATAKTYGGPFVVSQTTTVKAFSVDNAGNVEPTGTSVVQIGSGGGTSGSVTLGPSDDSYTAKGNPTATHGSEGSINVNSGTSERRAHLKFTVSAIPPGAVGVTATLRAYSQSSAASTVTFTVSQEGTGWTEGGLTWNNQPAPGATVTTKAGLTTGAYNTFDVSGLINQNGTYALVISDNNTTQRYLSSKESSPLFPPQLVVSWTVP